MIEIATPKIEIQESNEDLCYGKFVCEPMTRGYGITIGDGRHCSRKRRADCFCGC